MKIRIAFFLSLLCIEAFAEDSINQIRIYFGNNIDTNISSYLVSIENARIERNILVVDRTVKKEKMFVLLEYFDTKIRTNIENIISANKTKNSDGSIYKRHVVQLDNKGIVKIVIDPNNHERLVYDPIHPDSKKDGNLKGYVVYPGISKQIEMSELYNNIMAFNVIATSIMKIDNTIVIEKNDFNSIISALGNK
jgi:flagellar basal body rod protein FlgC